MNLKELIDKLKLCDFKNENFLENVKNIIKEYNTKDYKELIEFSTVTYNKVYVYNTLEFDLVLICWKKGQNTKIHDHPDYCCYIKMLEGSLLEENFINTNNTLKTYENVIIKPDDITFKCKNNVVHRIIPLEDSISLHIYMPGLYKPNYFD
jgi:cysteine dioxygenase